MTTSVRPYTVRKIHIINTIFVCILFLGHKLLAGGFLTYILSKEILILHDEVLMQQWAYPSFLFWLNLFLGYNPFLLCSSCHCNLKQMEISCLNLYIPWKK